MSFDPYAPPKATETEEPAAPHDPSFDALAERVRWAGTESHVSAIGVMFFVPVLAVVFVIIGLLRGARGGAISVVMTAVILAMAASMAFGAHRLRRLRPEGRLVVTLFCAAMTGLFFAQGMPSGFLAFIVLPGIAAGYLWIGNGAHVLGRDHARALAATPERPIPTALWGWLVFWGIAIVWALVALRMLRELLS